MGQGGQILLSDVAASLVRQGSNQATMIDLGLHELKDLEQPERIWQVVDPSVAPSTAAPGRANRPARPDPAPSDDGQQAPFIGRSSALATFDEALARARGGTSATFLVSGEAGVGKTRLVTEWSRRARAGEAAVLTGSCTQLRAVGIPYAPVVEALRRLTRERGVAPVRDLLGPGRHAVARLVPELDPSGSREELEPWGQGQLFEAVLELLTTIGSGRSSTLVVEDLHWADLATLDLLNFLIRNVVNHGVIIVATMRVELASDHPLRVWATELARLDGVERIELAPFSRAEVFELLAEPAGVSPDPRVAEEIFRRSGGNAFFAEELRHAADHGGVLPPTLRDTLLARASTLGPSAQQVLKQLAVGGGQVTHELLAAIAGTDENALLASIDEAVTAHVIVIDGDGYAFRHAAFCEVIYDSLLPAERRKIHASFGKVLTQRPELGGPPERAAHWTAVGDVERALPATIDAAMAAEKQHAPAEAQRYWERALDLWPARSEPAASVRLDRVELLDRAAEAANRSGAVARALEWVDEAIAEVDRQRRSQPRSRAGIASRTGRRTSTSGEGGTSPARVATTRPLPPTSAR